MKKMNKKNRFAIVVVFIIVLAGLLIAGDETKDPFEMSLAELMEVKIRTAGKTDEPIRRVPASIGFIIREDIETLGCTSLAELLENIPGMYPVDDYSGELNKNVVIMINSVSQLYQPHDSYPLIANPIPIEAIERVEVVRGPLYIIYGTGAFFGAVNIITTIPGPGILTRNGISADRETIRQRRFFFLTLEYKF